MKPDRRRFAWLTLVPAAAAVLAPKCPLCLAAYLSWAGVSFGVASFAAPWLLPFGVVLAVLGLVVLWVSQRAAESERAQRNPTDVLP
jgi:hypothetical protein